MRDGRWEHERAYEKSTNTQWCMIRVYLTSRLKMKIKQNAVSCSAILWRLTIFVCVCALHLWHLVCLSVSIFFTMPLLEGSPLSMTHWLPLPESCLTLFASRSRMCHEPLCASFPWMPQSAKEDDRPSEANETISHQHSQWHRDGGSVWQYSAAENY